MRNFTNIGRTTRTSPTKAYKHKKDDTPPTFLKALDKFFGLGKVPKLLRKKTPTKAKDTHVSNLPHDLRKLLRKTGAADLTPYKVKLSRSSSKGSSVAKAKDDMAMDIDVCNIICTMLNMLTSLQGDEKMYVDVDGDIKMASPVLPCGDPIDDYMDFEDCYTSIVMASPTSSPALDSGAELWGEQYFPPPGLPSLNNLAPALSWNGSSWVPRGHDDASLVTLPWEPQLTQTCHPTQPDPVPSYRTPSPDFDIADCDPSSKKDDFPLEQSARLGNLPPSPCLNTATSQTDVNMAMDNAEDDLDHLCLLMQSLSISDSEEKEITAGSSSGIERALKAPLTARARRAACVMKPPLNKSNGRHHSSRYRTDKVQPGGLRKSKTEELARSFKLGMTPAAQATTAIGVDSGAAKADKPLKKASQELHVEREVPVVLRITSGGEVRHVRLPIVVPPEISSEDIDLVVQPYLASLYQSG